MMFLAIFTLAVFVSKSLAESTSHAYRWETSSITEKEVEILNRYADYSASAPCNINTPIGAAINCPKNCDSVNEDRPIMLKTYLGKETEIGAYMAVIHSRKQIVFVGRGASTDKNWETAFDFGLVPNGLVNGAMVHRGFHRAWSEISESVRDTLRDAESRYPGYSIVFTGGSFGGAIATYGAANLRAAGYAIDLYTYGSPRIGNGILSNFITNQPGARYRVTHGEDPVPRLPPTMLFPAYRHISPEYWLTGDPADPDHWPLEEITICEGDWNLKCNGNPLNGLNWSDHTYYFGPVECWDSQTTGNEDGVAYIMDLLAAYNT